MLQFAKPKHVVVVRGPQPVLEAGGETAAVATICAQVSP
jgi:hypothetical protein